MPLPIIQSLWIGNELSKLEQLCIRSFLDNGHPFHLYTYQDVAGVPTGTTLCDANTILAESEIFFSHRSLAHYSDWFRWKMLEKLGGYWVDMDLICLRPFLFDQEIVFGKVKMNRRGSVGILGFPVQHPLTTFMVHRCENPNWPDPQDTFHVRLKKYLRKNLLGNKKSNVGWGEAGGPRGFSTGIIKYELAHYARPPADFYPIPPWRWRSIFDTTYAGSPAPIESAYAIHLWGELLRRYRIDKNATFPNNSLIEQLKSRYNL